MEKPNPLQKNNVTVAGNLDAERTIVFVHGFGTDQTAWNDVAAAFRDDFRLVLLDNMGAGKSDLGAFAQHRYLDLTAYAADLLDVCEALRLQDAILVGHSVGAMISILAAIEKPQLFSKLVLIGASPRYIDDGDYRGGCTQRQLDELYSLVTLRYSEWADTFAAAAMGNPDEPRFARHFAETIKSVPPQYTLTLLCAIFQSDHRKDLDRLDKPALLIQAQEDVAVPLEVAEYAHAHLRGSQLRVIDATGHLPHVSAPDKVLAAMEDFVRGNP